jgi:TolB protein
MLKRSATVAMHTAFGLALAAALFVFPACACAEDNAVPLMIALPGFTPSDPADIAIAASIEWTITADLRRGDLFFTLSPFDQFGAVAPGRLLLTPPPSDDVSGAPPFGYWRDQGAQAVVTGRLIRQADGRLKTEVRLWDVTREQPLSGQQYLTEPENWRRLAHVIADHIYEQLTGKQAHFEADDKN